MKLHEIGIFRRTSVNAKGRQFVPRLLLHQRRYVVNLIGDGIEDGADHFFFPGHAGNARIKARRLTFPIRSAETRKGRHEIAAVFRISRLAKAIVSSGDWISCKSSLSQVMAAPV